MSVYQDIYKNSGLSDTQKKILEIVGEDKKVLEIGPAAGYMTKLFKENKCLVDIVEMDLIDFKKSSKFADNAIEGSIEDPKIYLNLDKDYDFIILADVLEHLIAPEITLHNLCKLASDKTQMLISMPNIASWKMRKQLFFNGDFEYKESGVLDKTHLHFYTVKSLPKLISSNGWNVVHVIGTVKFLPLQTTLSNIPLFGFVFKKLYESIFEKYPNLAYYHFLVTARKL